jgi:voltage-gated potassium channel
MKDYKAKPQRSRLKRLLHEIIFEADTRFGKIFDIGLIATILLSVFVVMLESITTVREQYGATLRLLEWGFTLAFTIEYLLRLYCVGKPLRYATSFYGIVDLLAIIPTYLSVFLPGSQYLIVIRSIRILRVFRVLKLVQYWTEASTLAFLPCGRPPRNTRLPRRTRSRPERGSPSR